MALCFIFRRSENMKKINSTQVLSIAVTALGLLGTLLSSKLEEKSREEMKAEIKEELKEELR